MKTPTDRTQEYKKNLWRFEAICLFMTEVHGEQAIFMDFFMERLKKDFLMHDPEYIHWKTEHIRKFREKQGSKPLEDRQKTTQKKILRLVKK